MAETIGFRVRRAGTHALRLLRAEAPLRVVAVFERSVYLESDGAFACLGGAHIGMAPLNAIIDAPPRMNWPASGLSLETRCLRAPRSIHLGARFALSLDGLHPWQAEAAPERPEPAVLAPRLPELLAVCAARCALHGLPAGRAGMAGARSWLGKTFARVPGDEHDMAWVSGLIGLGPGLTPSGDDFLGGVLIALHALGCERPAQRLGGTVLAAASGTSAISAAHLATAVEGQGSAALHALLNDLLRGLLRGRGTSLETRLAALGRIGHTSGWDTLAGALAVLEAWLARTAERPAA